MLSGRTRLMRARRPRRAAAARSGRRLAGYNFRGHKTEPRGRRPQAFDEAAVVSGREVRAQDEPHVEWPHVFDARAATAESGRRAVRAQSGREQFPWEQGIDDRATTAGAALRTTAEEMLRAGWAQPAPGRARALRAASILGLFRWFGG